MRSQRFAVSISTFTTFALVGACESLSDSSLIDNSASLSDASVVDSDGSMSNGDAAIETGRADAGPQGEAGTFAVGAGDEQLRLPAPVGEATMSIDDLKAAGGNISGSNVIVRGGTWASGQITITGTNVTLTGITFSSAASDMIRITGKAANIRIYRNIFNQVGSGEGAGSIGVIKVDPDPAVSDNGSSQRIAIARALTIDENRFNQPKNAVMWVNHGNQKIRFSHNTIVGPAFTPSGDSETEALKFGWNSGDKDDAQSVMAFNTLENYDGRPYTVGFKQSGWSVIGNILSRRTELRSANRLRVIGNVVADGDLHGGGSDHVIAKNYIRTLNDRDGFGPVAIYETCGFPPYDTPGNWFYTTLTASTFRDNTIVNEASSGGFATLMFHAQYATVGGRPQGNSFLSNLLVSKVGEGKIGSNQIVRLNNDPGSSLDTVLAANTWSDNRVSAPSTPIGVPPNASIVPTAAVEPPTTVQLSVDELPAKVAP